MKILCLALLVTCAALVTSATAANMSNGTYAIPYKTGTKIKVTRDHLTHSPRKTRIDMKGNESPWWCPWCGGGPYRIRAAAAGTIRFIQDSFSGNGDCDKNNYVWIEHANGEWTKYSHMKKGSTTGTAGLSVGDVVSAGTFLGIEDNVGCASGDHLHFEVAVPHNPADPIHVAGGFIKGINRIPHICNHKWFVDDKKYTSEAIPANFPSSCQDPPSGGDGGGNPDTPPIHQK